MKLNSLGIAVDEANLPDTVPFIFDGGIDLAMITRAIAEHQILEFTYRNYDLSEEDRRVVPIGLSTRSGFWYFTGVDQSIEEVRTFRFDRVIGTFSIKKGPKGFETPEDFDAQRVFEKSSHENAVIDIRRGKGTSLRALAIATRSMGEWGQVQIPILDMKTLSSLLLWHGDDVYVHSPADLREEIISSLKNLVNLHG